jgi:hypothetical protein
MSRNRRRIEAGARRYSQTTAALSTLPASSSNVWWPRPRNYLRVRHAPGMEDKLRWPRERESTQLHKAQLAQAGRLVTARPPLRFALCRTPLRLVHAVHSVTPEKTPLRQGRARDDPRKAHQDRARPEAALFRRVASGCRRRATGTPRGKVRRRLNG